MTASCIYANESMDTKAENMIFKKMGPVFNA